ncbi:addiction module HigA family antidote [Variovorax paradoxus]|uniref:HigA family addiction module antitoxin n=1 Tax=Variovorax paradoxus TaxID=34073 RepID=UPI00278B66D2|nr:HigA family addiction module antitoxin [Variovorax paradoxus]MDQ0027876.1 addiction module HigA family antidote [Variovorax paradoxus]
MTDTVHHPGEILAQRLEAVGVSPTELARQLRVPANRITQIIHGQRGITGDSALRLAHWFGDEPELWMNLQARYDLEIAEAETGQEIHGLPIFMPTALAAQGRPIGAKKTRRRVA